jgi:hypothetical protein
MRARFHRTASLASSCAHTASLSHTPRHPSRAVLASLMAPRLANCSSAADVGCGATSSCQCPAELHCAPVHVCFQRLPAAAPPQVGHPQLIGPLPLGSKDLLYLREPYTGQHYVPLATASAWTPNCGLPQRLDPPCFERHLEARVPPIHNNGRLLRQVRMEVTDKAPSHPVADAAMTSSSSDGPAPSLLTPAVARGEVTVASSVYRAFRSPTHVGHCILPTHDGCGEL